MNVAQSFRAVLAGLTQHLVTLKQEGRNISRRLGFLAEKLNVLEEEKVCLAIVAVERR